VTGRLRSSDYASTTGGTTLEIHGQRGCRLVAFLGRTCVALGPLRLQNDKPNQNLGGNLAEHYLFYQGLPGTN
jgi:hypothetical protein